MSACAFKHVALPAWDRPRCIWWDRGAGTVVARIQLGALVTGYDVELDEGDGRAERALPSQIRLIPAQRPQGEPKRLRFSHHDDAGAAVFVAEREPVWGIPPVPAPEARP